MGTERGAAPPAAPPTPPSAHPLPPKSCPHATPVPSAAVAPGCAVPLVPLSPSPHLPRGAGHRVCASLGEVPGCQQRADLCPRVSLPVLTIKGQEHPGVKVPASFRGFGAPREPRYPRGNDTPGALPGPGWHRDGTRPVPMDVSPRELGNEWDAEMLPNPTVGDPGAAKPYGAAPFSPPRLGETPQRAGNRPKCPMSLTQAWCCRNGAAPARPRSLSLSLPVWLPGLARTRSCHQPWMWPGGDTPGTPPAGDPPAVPG